MHAVEHLGRHDHRLLVPLAGADDPLLHHRHAGHVGLHTEIAAGHHYSVGSLYDRVEIFDCLPLLDLGHDPSQRATGPEQLLEQFHLQGRTDKRQADEIDPGRCGPLRMLPVDGADRGHREPHARQVDTLPAADGAPLNDAAPHLLGIPLDDDQADRPISEHHRVAQGEFVNERLVCDGELAGTMGFGATNEADVFSLGKLGCPTGQFTQTDLGTSQVSQNSNRPGQRLRDPPDPGQRLRMLIDGAVGHVEPEDVDPRLDKTPNGFLAVRGGAEGGDDLGADDFRRGRAGRVHGGRPGGRKEETPAGPDGTISRS